VGLAALRRDMLSRLLSDRLFAQGSHLMLDPQGITEGPLVDRMRSMILSLEGPDHMRMRRLVSGGVHPEGRDGVAAADATDHQRARRRVP
jgi:cytochrome P450